MLVRRDEFRASKIMQERVKRTANIEILYNTETKEILGNGSVVESVVVFNNKTKEEKTIPITGFFVAIGHTPNTSPILLMDDISSELDKDNANLMLKYLISKNIQTIMTSIEKKRFSGEKDVFMFHVEQKGDKSNVR